MAMAEGWFCVQLMTFMLIGRMLWIIVLLEDLVIVSWHFMEMMPCTLTRFPGPLEEEQPHNITEPPPTPYLQTGYFQYRHSYFLEKAVVVVLETWRPQDATFLCISPTVILEEFFASLIILLAVHGGKISIGPLPGKFVTIPVAFNFLSIALT